MSDFDQQRARQIRSPLDTLSNVQLSGKDERIILTARGRVSIAGTLGGVLFLAIIDNGLNLMGLNYLVKDALVGVILVVALALSFWQARLRQTHR